MLTDIHITEVMGISDSDTQVTTAVTIHIEAATAIVEAIIAAATDTVAVLEPHEDSLEDMSAGFGGRGGGGRR